MPTRTKGRSDLISMGPTRRAGGNASALNTPEHPRPQRIGAVWHRKYAIARWRGGRRAVRSRAAWIRYRAARSAPGRHPRDRVRVGAVLAVGVRVGGLRPPLEPAH